MSRGIKIEKSVLVGAHRSGVAAGKTAEEVAEGLNITKSQYNNAINGLRQAYRKAGVNEEQITRLLPNFKKGRKVNPDALKSEVESMLAQFEGTTETETEE